MGQGAVPGRQKVKIIKFNESDLKEIVSLFYETVYSVNSKDYSKAELDAWAPIEEKNDIENMEGIVESKYYICC